MKRRRPWIRRVVRGLILSAIILLGLWLTLGRTLVERVVTAQLESFGLPRPSLRVDGSSPSHVEITHLSFGPDDRLKIASVGIDYSASQLLRKQVDSIEIVGLEAEIRRRHGAWDFGPLAGLRGSADGGTPDEMPFRRITLRASTLTVDLDGRRLRIPIDGTMESTGRDLLSLDLTADFDGASLQLTGDLNVRSQDFALALAGDVPDLAHVLTALAPSLATAAGQLREGLVAKVAVIRRGGAVNLDATARGTGWQLARITASETGLEDWLRGKADVARVEIHGEAGVDNALSLLERTPLASWVDGQPPAKGQLSADGILELRYARTESGPKWTWSANMPNIRATVAPVAMTVPGSAAFRDVSLDLRMAARADAKNLQISLLPDSWAAVASIDVPVSSQRVTVSPVRFALRERDDQPLLAVNLEDERLASAAAALVAETAAPTTVSIGQGTTATLARVRSVFEGTSGTKDGSFAGDLQIDGIDVNLHQKLGSQTLTAALAGAALHATTRRNFPAGAAPAEPLRIEFVAGTSPGQPGISAAIAGVDVATGKAEVRGSVTLAGPESPAVSVRASLADTSVTCRKVGLDMTGVTVDVPLAWNATPSEPGRVAVKSVELQGVALPSPSATFSLAGTRADFAVAWEPLAGARLQVEGSAYAGSASRGPSARAYISLPLFEITDDRAIGRLVPPLRGLLARGSFAVDGHVRVSADGVAPNIALTVLDGSFMSKAWEAQAEGVFATVRIDGIDPLLTPRKELQVALVRRASMGKLEVNDGFVAFRIEPKETDGRPTGWTAYVQRAECGWAGGRLYIEDFRFDPRAAEHSVTVSARDLKLGQLLAFIPDQRATGVGSLDGRLPVTIGTWPDLRFGAGELRTAPGQSGWFRLKDTEVLGTVLEGTDPRFLTDSLYVEVKRRLVNAFKNFEYDELGVVLTKDKDGKTVGRVTTRGRARTGERQEFAGVTLNFLDFDEALRNVILISRGVQTLK